MDAPMNHILTESQKFRKLCQKAYCFPPRSDSRHEIELSNILDEFNSFDYGAKFVNDEDAVSLLCRLSESISSTSDHLVSKYSQLLSHIVANQKVHVDLQSLHTLVQYMISAIQACQQWTLADTLRALGALLYENTGRLDKFHDVLLSHEHGILIDITSNQSFSLDVRRAALQCVENMCMKTQSLPYLQEVYVSCCLQLFLTALQMPRDSRENDVSHCRILVSALRGIQNIATFTKNSHMQQLGRLLAALKVYMMYGLPGQSPHVPDSLFPTPLSRYDPSPNPSSSSSQSNLLTATPAQEARVQSGRKKKTDARKKRKGNQRKTPRKGDSAADEREQGSSSGQEADESNPSLAEGSAYDRYGLTRGLCLQPTWRVSSSESEYSDTEGGQTAKLRSMQGKVRQCAFSTLLQIVKATEKKVIFGYWSSFLPDSPVAGSGSGLHTQTLITSVMKDPSPKVRQAALGALTAMLDNSKQYLAAAEDSESCRSAAFTAFSVSLGSMIKELHRSLLLAMSAENSFLALTQSIKCLAVLVLNVPYHRLHPGLLTKLVKQLRNFMNHRDPNVRVACLTCLGSVLQAPVTEVLDIFQGAGPESKHHRRDDDDDDSGDAAPRMSWLIEACIANILTEQDASTSSDRPPGGAAVRAVPPLPVRLESLQVLAIMAKHHFPVIRPVVGGFSRLMLACLQERETSVRLHTVKLLEDLGFSMLQSLAGKPPDAITVDEAVAVWGSLVGGPLLGLLQTTGHTTIALRATVCDCLSNMGAVVFELLPLDRRIACITLLLGLIADEDYRVRGAAVRALGFYVLFPSLVQDVGFVTDSAAAILSCMEDSVSNVRVKAMWSAGNVCDALILNKDKENGDFLSEFPDALLLQFFRACIAATQDNDKVKYSAVRALGNLLRYAPHESLQDPMFVDLVEQAVSRLVRNMSTGAVKVRWNSCYALGNMFRNDCLPLGSANWVLCATLLHLSWLLAKDDLEAVNALVCEGFDVLSTYLAKYTRNLALAEPPVKGQTVSAAMAMEHLCELSGTDLTTAQVSALEGITVAFSVSIEQIE
ncbi:PREDICTED: HEAT repeat-containing protein 6-like isoform X2 [Priapulus caudatus]|uniref:HEAT repeat-containing protein 6 n=1 Tax=Priapulus caudatus TaxID=37621 RepID=A0ABM1DYD6_PRICU|nr:PREDICTED: HEAT repeat-containing protein 6-like isoform X2 [Priapulus caudatus]